MEEIHELDTMIYTTLFFVLAFRFDDFDIFGTIPELPCTDVVRHSVHLWMTSLQIWYFHEELRVIGNESVKETVFKDPGWKV